MLLVRTLTMNLSCNLPLSSVFQRWQHNLWVLCMCSLTRRILDPYLWTEYIFERNIMCVIACNYTGILKMYTKIMNIPIARHNLIYNDSLPQCYGRGLYFMAAVTVPPLIFCPEVAGKIGHFPDISSVQREVYLVNYFLLIFTDFFNVKFLCCT